MYSFNSMMSSFFSVPPAVAMLLQSAATGGPDKHVEAKARVVAADMSECLHIAVHDPSMALYRVQEHVRKSLPTTVSKKGDMLQLESALQGACFDISNAIEVVEGMSAASSVFSRVHEQLRTAMYYKQQLEYERMRRERDRAANADENDLLWQELRKSKSLGQLRPSQSVNEMLTDSSIYSRSNTSTPLSHYPDNNTPGSATPDQSPVHGDVTLRAEASSSSSTDGADSSSQHNTPSKLQQPAA